LHATIGLLREPGDSPALTRPVVGLTGLGELIAAYRRSGLTVEHAVQGTACRIPPAADLTAYRVIQESLTNVCKHAARQAGAAARSAGAAGHGIVGMRDRAQLAVVAYQSGLVHAARRDRTSKLPDSILAPGGGEGEPNL
jgi:hypothetical protein